MSNILESRDQRTFIASAIFVGLVLLLIAYLTFIEVPNANKDLITAIISMMVGGLGVSLNKLFGSDNEDMQKLKSEIQEVRQENELLETKYREVKNELDTFREKVLEKVNLRED